ncbi:hypothetical protein RI367_006858 [Sorochytrium milnesiophthora]
MPLPSYAALGSLAATGQPHINLKLLSVEELEIFNKLLPLKNQLFTSKKTSLPSSASASAIASAPTGSSTSASKSWQVVPKLTRASLTAIADTVSELMQQHNALRGVGFDGEPLASHGGSDQGDTETGPRNALDVLFDTTHALILELYTALDAVSPLLLPIFTQLMSIQNSLEDLRISMCFTLDDVVVYQRRLRIIENTYVKDGRFVTPTANTSTVGLGLGSAASSENNVSAAVDNGSTGPTGASATTASNSKGAAADSQPQPPPQPGTSSNSGSDMLDGFGAQKGQAILFAKLNLCYRLASSLVLLIDTLDDDILPIHEKLVGIQRELLLLFVPKGSTISRVPRGNTGTAGTLSLSVSESLPQSTCTSNASSPASSMILHPDSTPPMHPALPLPLPAAPPAPVVTTVQLSKLQQRLQEVDNMRQEGQFLSPHTGKPMQGQALVIGILEHCYELIEDLLNKKDKVADVLYPIYEHLVSMKRRLQELLEDRWDVRPQDIFPFERAIRNIEVSQIRGVFYGPDNGDEVKRLADMSIDELKKRPIPNGQATLHYLLHKCHRLIYKLQSTIEPVDPALQGLHHHIIAVRKCLVEIKRFGGPFTPQELYPFQLKLKSFDDLRKDGKFVIEGEVPPGQGVLHSLLSECYEILNELKSEVEYD